jgi:hypothetical protein
MTSRSGAKAQNPASRSMYRRLWSGKKVLPIAVEAATCPKILAMGLR